MDASTTIIVALIGLAGTLGIAALNTWTLLKLSRVQANVQKVETATNSMHTELVRLSRVEGQVEGRAEQRAANDKTAVDVATGRAQIAEEKSDA